MSYDKAAKKFRKTLGKLESQAITLDRLHRESVETLRTDIEGSASDEIDATLDAITDLGRGAVEELRAYASEAPWVALAYAEEILINLMSERDPKLIRPNPIKVNTYHAIEVDRVMRVRRKA